MKDVFTDIYKSNFWKDGESASGAGSNMQQTMVIRTVLPELFKRLHVKVLLDIPCGDFFWFSKMWKDMPGDMHYIGADIVRDLVYKNRERYVHPELEFQVMDATRTRLPHADLILCRDMLGHLSNVDVKAALKNFRASGSEYLLATTFPGRENVNDIKTGEWRPINLASLFGLPDPLMVLNEGCTVAGGKFKDKSLGLWRLQ